MKKKKSPKSRTNMKPVPKESQTIAFPTIPGLLRGFQNVVNEWRAQFDNPPTLDLDFYVDDLGMLYLNGIVLCPVRDIPSSDCLTCEWDMFFLETETGDMFNIIISWPYEGEAYLQRIMKSRDIYVCKSAACTCTAKE